MPRGRPKKSASDAPPSVKAFKTEKPNGNGANLGFEAQLFLAADKLRKGRLLTKGGCRLSVALEGARSVPQ
jgi:hypothetical protein